MISFGPTKIFRNFTLLSVTVGLDIDIVLLVSLGYDVTAASELAIAEFTEVAFEAAAALFKANCC